MGDTVALLVAAGRGRRMSGTVPKQYRDLCGKPVLRRAIDAFTTHPAVAKVRVVIHPDDADDYTRATAGLDLPPPVTGGETRQDSVRLGLEALANDTPAQVLIHDGARPLVSPDTITRVIDALSDAPGAIPAIDVPDTLKRAQDGRIAETVPRDNIVRAQTPQGFRYVEIRDAHQRMTGRDMTDDAAVAEATGLHLALVAGEEDNMKITRDADLERAARILARRPSGIRVGSGFDVHRFGPGDCVRLGGIDISHTHGLAGHSDADVALHALTDALLGALADGDIGSHFPPTDPQWRDADSARFLAHAMDRLRARDGDLLHADLTLICEAPRIGPHRAAMQSRISAILDVDAGRVSIKATTTEALGFTGRREGIAAQATVTVELPIQ